MSPFCYLHFNDNTFMKKRDEAEYGSLFEVRPLLKHLSQQFGTIPFAKYNTVDEQIIPFKVCTKQASQMRLQFSLVLALLVLRYIKRRTPKELTISGSIATHLTTPLEYTGAKISLISGLPVSS